MAGPMQHPDALLADCLAAGPSPYNLHTQGKGGRILVTQLRGGEMSAEKEKDYLSAARDNISELKFNFS